MRRRARSTGPGSSAIALVGGLPLLAGLLAGWALAACGEPRPADVLPDSVYVRVMAHLVVAQQRWEESGTAAPGAASRADSARRATYEEFGVTAEDLRRYALEYGDDPEHMRRVWAAIADSVRALRGEDLQESDPPDPGAARREAGSAGADGARNEPGFAGAGGVRTEAG